MELAREVLSSIGLRTSNIIKKNFESYSPKMIKLNSLALKVAKTEAPVLLLGETGTGKNTYAHYIHSHSFRKNERFSEVNLSTLSESLIESELFGHKRGAFTGATEYRIGKIEKSHGGTLFLDEIGELSLKSQKKLLRFLETYKIEKVGDNRSIKVDTRVLAATNKNLKEMVKNGKFREDLYYRLNLFELRLPPLRERYEDIPSLTKSILTEVCSHYRTCTMSVCDSLFSHMTTYHWPGNLRELRNVLTKMVLLSEESCLRAKDLPHHILISLNNENNEKECNLEKLADLDTVNLKTLERKAIKVALRRGKKLEHAAKLLGITKVTLWRKRKEYNL